MNYIGNLLMLNYSLTDFYDVFNYYNYVIFNKSTEKMGTIGL